MHLVTPSPALVHDVARIVVSKDAPIVAAAVTARATFLATYDRKHLLRQAALISSQYRVTVAVPDLILSLT